MLKLKRRVGSLLFSLALLLSNVTAFAVNNDSLLYEATISTNKIQQIDMYVQLAVNYMDVDNEKTEEYINTALNLCEKHRLEEKALSVIIKLLEQLDSHRCYDLTMKLIVANEQFIDQSSNNKKVCELYFKAVPTFLDNSNYEMAMVCILKSLEASRLVGDTAIMISDVLNAGYCYGMVGDASKSIEYFEEAERLTLLCKNYKGLIDIYSNLGLSYKMLDKQDTALDYFFKALKYSIQTNEKAFVWLLYYNVACVYVANHDYNEALAYFIKALDSEDVNDPRCPKDSAMLYSSTSEVYEMLGQKELSIKYIKKSISLYHQQGKSQEEAGALFGLGNTYASMGNVREATNCYNKVVNLCNNDVSLALQNDIYKGISKFYSDNGDYRLSNKYLEKAFQISQNILAEEHEQTYNSLVQQLNVKEDIINVERQTRNERKTQMAENEQQESRRRTLLTFLLVVAIVTVFVVLILIHVRKTNVLLKRANAEINIKKEQLEVANNMARHRYEFLDKLISTMPTPFMYMDENSVVVGCNDEFELASGLSRKELIGFKLDDIIKESNIGLVIETRNQSENANVGKMRFADGNEHDVICHYSTLDDDGGYGKLTCILIVDVTELENARRELSESRKRLEDALNVKTKFFSIFAHDLKNPFNGILGLTNLLAECYDNYSSDDVRKYLNVINDSANNVYHLLNNLLDWAKSQTDMLEVNTSSFIVTESIYDAISLNEHMLSQKDITIERQFDDSFAVLADKNMILAVTRNLLGNAIKYTPVGGRIVINVALASPDFVKVSISDNGIGMSRENLEKLFNVDHPISTPGLNNEKGSGLGLIICKEFIRRNGGEIYAESVEGKGTTFTFTLRKCDWKA